MDRTTTVGRIFEGICVRSMETNGTAYEDIDTHTKMNQKNKEMKEKRRIRWLKYRYGREKGINRNKIPAQKEIDRLRPIMNLKDDNCKLAMNIYTKALKNKLIRGRSVKSVLGASIYIACRQQRVPRTLEDLASNLGIKVTEIGRTYKFIIRRLNIDLDVIEPKDYIDRFCSNLELSDDIKEITDIKNLAIKIIKYTENEKILSGKDPRGIAVAALYISSRVYHKRMKQEDIAKLTDVTENTIRFRYKEIEEKLGISVDDPHALSKIKNIVNVPTEVPQKQKSESKTNDTENNKRKCTECGNTCHYDRIDQAYVCDVCGLEQEESVDVQINNGENGYQ